MPVNQTSALKTLHRLLFEALLEIRSQAHEHGDKVAFHLADLFHNVVLEMENAAQGKATYEDALQLLEDRAKEKNCERWLNQKLADLEE